MSEPKMVDKKPCWTTSKEEADKLVDKLSEVCFEYGKNENNEKLLDVFYATKALKNYVGIMQGRIELLNARIAELEAALINARELIGMTPEPAFPKWIPISENPTKSDWYLIMYQGYRVPDAGYYHVDGGWLSDIPDCWMPLPEPPEVEK